MAANPLPSKKFFLVSGTAKITDIISFLVMGSTMVRMTQFMSNSVHSSVGDRNYFFNGCYCFEVLELTMKCVQHRII